MAEKIVIVQSGFLGDAVLASAMLRRLAWARPRPEVGIVVRAEFGDLFERHMGVARVHRFEKRARGGTAALVEELRAASYTLALIPHRSMRSVLAARRAGIARRIGFRQSDAPWLLSDRVDYDIAAHETMRNAALLAHAGFKQPAGDDLPWLIPQPAALDGMRRRFGGDRPVIAIAPGSVWATKRWSAASFARTAALLQQQGRRPVLIGSGGERELCATVAEQAGIPAEDVVCGSLSLVETLALIAMAERVVTNDSAPLHLAESVGTPVTAIFGPTVPEFGFGPRNPLSAVVDIDGLACRPCSIHGAQRCPIGTHECMTAITAERVVAASTGA